MLTSEATEVLHDFPSHKISDHLYTVLHAISYLKPTFQKMVRVQCRVGFRRTPSRASFHETDCRVGTWHLTR